MEYKRSKALYLGILAGISILAGIAHQSPSSRTISVQVTEQHPNTSVWVAEANQPIDQNDMNHEEIKPNTDLIID